MPAPVSIPTPLKLDLKKDERLRITWSDGRTSEYPVRRLRQLCPCAACKALRTGADPHQLLRPASDEELAASSGEHDARSEKPDRAREQRSRGAAGDVHAPTPPTPKPKKPLSLSVLPRNFVSDADPVTVAHAELVGNYALKLVFSDGHDTGIFSFAYLREIAE